jgi:hypothetical protein
MKPSFALITAFWVILCLACGGGPSPAVPGAVITVGDRALFPEDIEHSFDRYRGDSLSVEIFLENIIARELFLAHAADLGLAEDREIQRLMHERRREILQSEWLAWELDKVELAPGEALAFWESMGTGVVYTALNFQDSLLMEDVYRRVSAGADLADFAEQYGLEDLTRTTRGNISLPERLYSNNMDHDHLAGDISSGDIIGPFPVSVGHRILQIDSMWVYEPQPFSIDSPTVARLLLSRIREERKIFVEDSLKTAFGVSVDPGVIAMMNGRSAEGGFSFGDFSPEEENMIAVHWEGGSRDVFRVYRNILGLPGYLPRQTDSEVWLREYAERLALFDIEMQLAVEAGLDTIPDTARLINRKVMEVLLDEYYAQIIAPGISPDMAMIDSVYLRIRESMPVEESRTYNVLYLENPERVAAAQAMMDSGTDVLTHSDEFQVFPPVLAPGEDHISSPLTRAVIPEMHRETFFSMEVGDEAVINLDDSTGLWIRLLEVEPERLPEFEEIRTSVLRAAEMQQESSIIESLVDSLSAVYHPYVDREYFRQFHVAALDEDGRSGVVTGEVN